MGFKNFLIGIIKNIIVLFVATLIFSSITLDFPELIRGLFGDIFGYASPEVQKKVVSQLAETCSSLDKGESIVTINQLCVNRSILESMRENCANYRELKRRNIKVENEEEIRKTCFQIESGEIEEACNQLGEKNSLLPDFSNIGALCKDYKSGKINDREFFFNVISGAIPTRQMQMPSIGFLERYNQAINYLNNNKIIYFVILAILIFLLYLLIMDIKLFLIALSGISFSIGILIMLPYFAILAYDNFVGIDTTPLLGSMFGLGNFDFKAVLSVVLLLFLRTYTQTIITLGIVFLIIGIAGKVYKIILKRKLKTKEKPKEEIKEMPKPKKKKKVKKS